MAYQVLARKWRPKNFEQLVGQEHVVTVLVNALMQERLHHAYLFTGTRGVGKTTIARIFAKSLNCETGVTATPCGKCDTCIDIDQGKFIDLLEIDAASRTKVDDTREILDNVQYSPTRGRYKVYLIDEVHMLSRSSFNALLKTLEEPPAHVKFILATTDPQKLPVTVLSRCLQFHLKALTNSQISSKLDEILTAEDVGVEDGTLKLLAKAARGSMRDSLSLTDQAISQGKGHLTVANIQEMLGGIDQNWPFKILVSLIKKDSEGLMSLSLEIASYSPNYARLIAELLQLLHQIALSQVIEQHFDMKPEQESVFDKLKRAMSPEDVQLFYQISLNARKDLPYVGDDQAAFDMLMLRLLAFKPMVRPAEQVIDVDTNKSIQDFDDIQLETTLNQAATNESSPNVSSEIETQIIESKADSASSEVSTKTDKSAAAIQPEQSETVTPELNEQALAPTLDEEQQQLEQAASEASELIHQAAEPESSQEYTLEKVPELFTDSNSAPHYDSEPTATVESVSSKPTAVETPTVQSSALETASDYAEQSVENEIASASEVVSQKANATEVTEVQPKQAAPQIQYNSPVEAALATRNMLRSRRKQLEKDSKKSDGAVGRQLKNTDTSQRQKDQTDNKPNVPDISSVPNQPFSPDIIDPTTIRKANQVDKWANMIDAMELTARIRQLAIHATIDEQSTEDVLKLKLDQTTKHLVSDTAHKQLEDRISELLSKKVTVEVEIVEQTIADPYQIQSTINDKRLDYAISVIKEDPLVNKFIQDFQAELVVESITAR